jgi:hypothetical protein
MTTKNLDERVRVAHTTRGHADGLLGIGLIALGIGLAGNSLLGPFGFGVVDYPLSETLHNQTIGLDAVSLLLVAPVSLAVGIARRGNRAAPYVAVSIGAYTAYMFVQYIVGPSYLGYPRILPLQLSLFVLGWAVAFRAWYISRSTEPLLTPGRLSRRHAIALFAFAAFVILRYAPALGGVVAGDPIPPDAVGDPAMFWTIVLMDLGIFVPLSLAAGVALRRGRTWAPGSLYAAAGWFLLVTTAVAAMAITMLVNDDPHAAPGQVVIFAITELLVIAYVTVLYRPLVRRNFAQ